MNRRLTLKREQLAALTSDDLAAVGGGQEIQSFPCLTGYYPTIERPCESVQPCIYIDQTPLCPTEI